MARLSVNLNKIALLRNSRHTGVPDVLEFAKIAISAGAAGITLHPRQDERHVRRTDVPAIAKLMAPYRPKLEFNIEGYPDERFLEIVREVKPEQCTLVPDASDAFTSDEGWKLDAKQMKLVKSVIPKLKALGSRIILFVDPGPTVMARVKETGADGIEIYTGGYAEAFRTGKHSPLLEMCVKTAEEAHAQGLAVNIGHDLNLKNLPPIVSSIPFLAEASIGHELTADALKIGFAAAVRAYRAGLAPEETTSAIGDPMKQFEQWFTDAEASGTPIPNAMILSTASKESVPSARIVLLKGFDDRGLVFFTNYESRKARELEENPRATLLFHWPESERQIRISGMVSKVSKEESEEYFKSRPHGSRIGAWASKQSSIIGSRKELEKKMDELRKRYEGKDIPLPPHWGGYRLMPTEFEFWQGGVNRLHDRILYEKKNEGWARNRLSP